MTPNANEPDHAGIRAAVRDYLDRWESWEKENRKQASITSAEFSALSLLAQRPFEQELDDYNYVGELGECIAKKGLGFPCWDEQEFTDPLTKQRVFRVTAKLPKGKGVFPREGYGIIPGKEAQAYPTKKRAKQFAAKCAVSWLNGHPNWAISSQGSSPSDNDSGEVDAPVEKDDDVPEVPEVTDTRNSGNAKTNRPAPTAESSPSRKKAKVGEPEAQAGAPLTSPETKTFSDSYAPLSEEPPSLSKQVDTLAKRLGFDAPRYKITREFDGTWSGRAIFQLDGRMPEDLGFVTGLDTDAQARTEVARIVLKWLAVEYKSRFSELDKMLKEYDPTELNINRVIYGLEQQLKT